MSDVRGLEEWKGTVAEHLPHLSKPQAVVLALYSFGMVLARSCGLSAATTCRREPRGLCRSEAWRRA